MSHFLDVYKSPLHGDGVKTPQRIAKDEILYIEAPALLLQSINNRQDALVCSHCSRFIGSVELQLKFLQKMTDRLRLNDQSSMATLAESQLNRLSDICPCMLYCGEIYCGEMCRRMHWELKGHSLLCTGQLTEETVAESPLYQFKLFSVQTNEIFLLVAEMIAEICTIQDRNGSEGLIAATGAINRFSSFVQNPWWEVATATKKGKAKAKLEKSLRTLVKDAYELLQDVFHLEDRGLSTLINEEFISRTIGMFEQNNVGVRLPNPVAEFALALGNEDPRLDCMLEIVMNIKTFIESQADCEEEYKDIESGDEDEENKDDGDENVATKSETVNDEPATSSSEVVTVTGKKAELMEVIQEVGEENLFPPLDGTAFYMLTCKINHSCDPNVCVKYTTDPVQGLVAQLVAIRDIEVGEELVQSYIDQSLPTKERQDALRDYGFQCTCVRCTSEQ